MDAARDRTPDIDPRGLLDTPIALHTEVERLVGADDAPMLLDNRNGRYVRISPLGTRVLDQVEALDAPRTGEQLIDLFSGGDAEREERARNALLPFFNDLYDKGLLEGAPLPEKSKAGPTLMLRLPLKRDPARVLAPVARLLTPMSGRVGVFFAVVTALAALAVVLTSFTQVAAGLDFRQINPFGLLLPFTAVLVHEASHALLLLRHGAPPRSAGIGLLLYVLPMAYVDRTDSYRIRRRGARVALALAGPWCDLVFAAGASLIVVTTQSPAVAATFAAFALFQMLAVLFNLNPFLPSDGYQALEAALGETNARSRAFRWVGHTVRRTPMPPELGNVRGVRLGIYLLLFVTTCVYIPLIAAMFISVGISMMGAL